MVEELVERSPDHRVAIRLVENDASAFAHDRLRERGRDLVVLEEDEVRMLAVTLRLDRVALEEVGVGDAGAKDGLDVKESGHGAPPLDTAGAALGHRVTMTKFAPPIGRLVCVT